VNQANRRTWKQETPQSTNRLQMLVGIGALALVVTALFIYWIARHDTLATYVTSVSVEDYQGTIPSVLPWKPGRLIEAAKTHSYRPFQEIIVDKQRFTHQGHLDTLATDLAPFAQQDKYPLVLQLRCQTAVRSSTDGLQCELLVDTSSGAYDSNNPKNGTGKQNLYSLETFLEQLLEFPSSNIIVLADIADLKFLPSEGIVINPLESAIQATCARLEKKMKRKGQELWIICPTADGQTALRNRTGQTLFQLACDEAFRSTDSELTLASYYANVLRFCFHASQKTQTPILFRARDSKARIGPDNALAKKVRLTIFEKSIGDAAKTPAKDTTVTPDATKSKDATKPADEGNSSAAILNLERDGSSSARPLRERIVSLQTQGASSSTGTTEVNSTQPPQQTVSGETIPKSIWQLRDRWNSTSADGTAWTWTAADYAPMQWRWSLYQLSSPKSSIRNADGLDVFLQWDREAHQLNSKEQSTVAMQNFVQSRARGIWMQPDVIAKSKREEWRSIQREYRKYILAVSEFLFWRDLVMTLPASDRVSAKSASSESGPKDLMELIGYLQQMHQRLPSKDAQGAIDSWQRFISSPVSGDPLAPLQMWLESQIKQLEAVNRWTWLDEHRSVGLLASPVLSLSQRQRLEAIQTKQSIVTELPDQKLDLNQIVNSQPNPESLVNQGKLFLDCAKTCSQLYGWPLPSLEEKSNGPYQDLLHLSDRYREHQQTLVERLRRRDTNPNAGDNFSERIQRWHVYNLAELGNSLIEIARMDPQGSCGIVVLPLNANAIEVRIADSFVDVGERSVTATFLAGVDYLGQLEDPLTQCELLWTTEPFIPDLQLSVDNKVWPPNRFTSVGISNKSIRVQVNPPKEGFVFPPNTRIYIRSQDQDIGASIPILQSAAAIELLVKEQNAGRNPSVSQLSKGIFQISGPIFKGAFSRFEFAIQNKLPKKRFASVRLFAVSGKERRIAESAVVELPAAIPGQPGFPQSAVSMLPMRTEEAPRSPDSELSRFRYEIQEFDSMPVVPDGNARVIASPKPTAIFEGQIQLSPKDPRSYTEIEFDPNIEIGFAPRLTVKSIKTNPFPGEIELKAQSVHGAEGFAAVKTLKNNGQEAQLNLIRLDRNTDALFSLDIADFPRAHFYSLNANTRPTFSETPVQNRMDPTRISFAGALLDPPAELEKNPWLELDKLRGQSRETPTLIFPAWIDTSAGRAKVRFSGLRIQGVFDTQPGVNVEWNIRKSNDATEETLLAGSWPDRSYYPDFLFDGGLSLRFDVGELSRVIDMSSLSSETSEQFELNVRAGNKAASWQLMFDRRPPNPKGRLIYNDGNRFRNTLVLFSDSKIEIEIETQDDTYGSGIKLGKISLSNEEDGKFNEKSPLSWLSNVFDEDGRRGLRFSVSPKAFESMPSGDYWLHLATFDRAGNQQSDHVPMKVSWKDAPQPKPTQNP
jgi:hypothetical protein